MKESPSDQYLTTQHMVNCMFLISPLHLTAQSSLNKHTCSWMTLSTDIRRCSFYLIENMWLLWSEVCEDIHHE